MEFLYFIIMETAKICNLKKVPITNATARLPYLLNVGGGGGEKLIVALRAFLFCD